MAARARAIHIYIYSARLISSRSTGAYPTHERSQLTGRLCCCCCLMPCIHVRQYRWCVRAARRRPSRRARGSYMLRGGDRQPAAASTEHSMDAVLAARSPAAQAPRNTPLRERNHARARSRSPPAEPPALLTSSVLSFLARSPAASAGERLVASAPYSARNSGRPFNCSPGRAAHIAHPQPLGSKSAERQRPAPCCTALQVARTPASP